MLRLYEQGPHAHVLKLPDGTEVLFSYETPVAGLAILPYAETRKFFKSSSFFSRSTSAHISKYLLGNGCTNPQQIDQHHIEKLVVAMSDVLTLSTTAAQQWNKENAQ